MKWMLFPSINEEKVRLNANRREKLCQKTFFADPQNEEIAGFRYG
jgi:hypothetical protein